MKVEQSKALANPIVALSLCPTMDLVAVATTLNVTVYRTLNLSLLFSLPYKGATALSWSHRGKLLLVGFDQTLSNVGMGSTSAAAPVAVRVVHTEGGIVVKEFHFHTPSGASGMNDGTTHSTHLVESVTEFFVAVLPSPLRSTLSVLGSSASISLDNDPLANLTLRSLVVDEWKETHSVTIVCAMDRRGNVAFLLEGMEEVGTINANKLFASVVDQSQREGLGTTPAASPESNFRVRSLQWLRTNLSNEAYGVGVLESQSAGPNPQATTSLVVCQNPNLFASLRKDKTLLALLATSYFAEAQTLLARVLSIWSKAVEAGWSCLVPAQHEGSPAEYLITLRQSITHSYYQQESQTASKIHFLFTSFNGDTILAKGAQLASTFAEVVHLLRVVESFVVWADVALSEIILICEEDMLLSGSNLDRHRRENDFKFAQTLRDSLYDFTEALSGMARDFTVQRDELGRCLRYAFRCAEAIEGTIKSPEAKVERVIKGEPLGAVGGVFLAAECTPLAVYLNTKATQCKGQPRTDRFPIPWFDTAEAPSSVLETLNRIRKSALVFLTEAVHVDCDFKQFTVRALSTSPIDAGNPSEFHRATAIDSGEAVASRGGRSIGLQQITVAEGYNRTEWAIPIPADVGFVSHVFPLAEDGAMDSSSASQVMSRFRYILVGTPEDNQIVLALASADGEIETAEAEDDDGGEAVEVRQLVRLTGIDLSLKDLSGKTLFAVAPKRGMCAVATGNRLAVLFIEQPPPQS